MAWVTVLAVKRRPVTIMMKLKTRLILTYALFMSLALLALAIIMNIFAGKMFEKFVRGAIQERSAEIVRAVSELYDPMSMRFDVSRLEAIGMLFVHEGYVIDVENNAGVVWDAREMDMQHCIAALREIESRMENQYGVHGELQSRSYPVFFGGAVTGTVNIATYGPLFYGENEREFLASLNSLLIALALLFVIISAVLSVVLALSISRPIVKASEAARQIANGNLTVRLDSTGSTDKTRELAGLTRSINEMAAALGEAERRQKQLTADIAHELRTPLACLQGGIEAMIDGVWEPAPERLQSCNEEVRRLAKLVDDLALLSSLEWESMRLNKTSFEIGPFLRLISDSFAPAAAEKNIVILCETPFSADLVIADYDRLKQVVINLLSNAVKYTAGGTITVSARPLPKNDAAPASWEITVADTGVGISGEDLPRIFDRFYRSDKSRNRDTGGHGLGLAIASAIIKAHGGTISAASGAENGGTVFRIQL
jgi:signal transduction histidine kinase